MSEEYSEIVNSSHKHNAVASIDNASSIDCQSSQMGIVNGRISLSPRFQKGKVQNGGVHYQDQLLKPINERTPNNNDLSKVALDKSLDMSQAEAKRIIVLKGEGIKGRHLAEKGDEAAGNEGASTLGGYHDVKFPTLSKKASPKKHSPSRNLREILQQSQEKLKMRQLETNLRLPQQEFADKIVGS